MPWKTSEIRPEHLKDRAHVVHGVVWGSSGPSGLEKVVFDRRHERLERRIILQSALRGGYRVQNRGVVPAEELTDVRQRGIEQPAAKVHRDLPWLRNVLAAAS